MQCSEPIPTITNSAAYRWFKQSLPWVFEYFYIENEHSQLSNPRKMRWERRFLACAAWDRIQPLHSYDGDHFKLNFMGFDDLTFNFQFRSTDKFPWMIKIDVVDYNFIYSLSLKWWSLNCKQKRQLRSLPNIVQSWSYVPLPSNKSHSEIPHDHQDKRWIQPFAINWRKLWARQMKFYEIMIHNFRELWFMTTDDCQSSGKLSEIDQTFILSLRGFVRKGRDSSNSNNKPNQ